MLKEAMHKSVPELAAIMSINSSAFGKSARGIDYCHQALLVDGKLLWPAFLCLLSAKTIGGVNKITIKLGCIMHLISISMHLHHRLPKTVPNTDFAKKIQMPILMGDLIYSKIFADINRWGLEQYLPMISSLICTIHERLVMPEYEEAELEALICETSCYFGAHSVIGRVTAIKRISELGCTLGKANDESSDTKLFPEEQLC